MKAYYSDRYAVPLPEGHTFPIVKYELLRRRLVTRGVLKEAELEEAPLVDVEILLSAHSAEYVRGILSGSVDADVMRRIGFPWSRSLAERALASAGGTWAAAQDALSGMFACNLGGGTHHAHRDTGEGFCVFNDFACAIRSLIQRGRIERAAIVDLDVHQGNGNASMLGGREDVMIFSMQGEKNFPVRRNASTIDVDLADNTTDEEYLAKLREHLPRVIEFKPGLLLYQAGVDPLREDRLGRLSLSLQGLYERDRIVFEACKTSGVPVCMALGGGYAEPIDLTVEAHINTIKAAQAVFDPPKAPAVVKGIIKGKMHQEIV